MAVTLDFSPALLPAPQAAHYIGVSESMLRTLDLPRRVLRGKRLYDRRDLDQFVASLPYEGQEDNTCDNLFGAEQCG